MIEPRPSRPSANILLIRPIARLKVNKILQADFFLTSSNSSARAGCDTRSISKWCLTGLNSEFSFSYIGCRSKSKKKNQFLLSIPSKRENLGSCLSLVHLCNGKYKQPSPGFEFGSLCPFPTTVTIIAQGVFFFLTIGTFGHQIFMGYHKHGLSKRLKIIYLVSVLGSL